MQVFDLSREQEFNPQRHVEKILGTIGGGDVTVACWEPGQISPYHCHPHATEIYFCLTGGGKMRTPERMVEITPGACVVHPAGELHEYENGPERTLTRALWRRHALASRRVARQPGLQAARRGRRVFPPAPAPLA
jgi:mannose-6-phosphate isomerase-like protein (cupin superfamily)